jgi:hypothetical protein
MADLILGPVLRHLRQIGLDRGHVRLITAFYSGAALSSLSITAPEVTFACRLDMSSIDDWGKGYVAPDKLLAFLTALSSGGRRVRLFASSVAHAKLYVGDRAALIGSANLTLSGFGGGEEILNYLTGMAHLRHARSVADSYTGLLRPVSLNQLENYVRLNEAKAKRLRAGRPGLDRLPRTTRSRRKHLGDYADFLRWLSHRRSRGATEVLARAKGKSNLSGHIHRNFFGLRQFLISYPSAQSAMLHNSPETYKLSKDAAIERLLSHFVLHQAADEDDFLVDAWRTYLPVECGGRAGRHGGTIGNLNFMLPLVATYLERVQSKR